MNSHASKEDLLPSRLKHLVAALFRPEISEPDAISDRDPLTGGKLGLDSLDALELALCIEEEFGLVLHNPADSQRAFASISSLVVFIHTHAQTSRARQHRREEIHLLGQGLPALVPG